MGLEDTYSREQIAVEGCTRLTARADRPQRLRPSLYCSLIPLRLDHETARGSFFRVGSIIAFSPCRP